MKNKQRSVPFFSLPLLLILFACPAIAQQNIISDVNNTHPEVDRLTARKAMITGFNVKEGNNCNEITWAAVQEDEVRKYIVEYSTNGLDFQTAGEVTAANKPYLLRHYFNYEHPAFYRIRTEQLNGKYFYSNLIPVESFMGSVPVEVYPTIVTNGTININASLPIERISIYTSNGAQVYGKDVGGQRDFQSLGLPNLSHGQYFMVFSGRNWKSTQKFFIQ